MTTNSPYSKEDFSVQGKALTMDERNPKSKLYPLTLYRKPGGFMPVANVSQVCPAPAGNQSFPLAISQSLIPPPGESPPLQLHKAFPPWGESMHLLPKAPPPSGRESLLSVNIKALPFETLEICLRRSLMPPYPLECLPAPSKSLASSILIGTMLNLVMWESNI